MTLEELKVVISAQTEPLKKGINDVKKQVGGLQKETEKATSGIKGTFKKLLTGVIALKIGQKIGQAITSGIKEAMKVESAIQQIKRIMGESSNMFLKWADTQALAFNMSKGQAIRYGAVFGNLVSGFASDNMQAMTYTTDLLKASSVIASSTGRSMEDVMERIRSGLLGNTEAIEDLGVNVNVAMIESTEAFKKFANGKAWNQIDFQTQQQIRLMAILEQTNKKYGDSVALNLNSQMQQLTAILGNVKLKLGEAFTPILKIIIPALTALAQKLYSIMSVIAEFSRALFGKSEDKGQDKQTKGTDKQANSVNKLGAAYTKAGKAAKGALAGFDEINSLSDSSSSGEEISTPGMPEGSNASSPLGINFDTNAPEISPKIKEMADSVRATVNDITNIINSNKDIILSVIAGIIAAIAVFNIPSIIAGITTSLSGIGAVLSVLISPIGLAAVAVGALVGSFVYLYNTNESFRNSINTTWVEISNTLKGFVNNTLIPIFNYIVNEFLAPLGQAFKSYILPVLGELLIGIGLILNDFISLITSTLNNIWGIIKPGLDLIRDIIISLLEIIKNLWDKYGNELISNIRAFIQGVQETFQLIWDNVINPIIKPALEMLTWLWNEHIKGLVQTIGEFIMKLVNGALEIYNKFIKPIVDWFVKTLGPPIANTVKFVIDVVGTLVAGISDVAKGIFKALGGIIDFIVGIFTGNWKKAWQGVKDIFGGIFDTLYGLVKVPLNFIIDAINWVIGALNKISINIPDWVPFFGGQTWGINIPNIPKLARGGIVDSPTLAMVGEAGKEMVVPLENTSFVDKLASALGTAVLSAMQFNTNNESHNKGDMVLMLDGTVLARVLNPYAEKESSRIGSPMIITT